MRTDTKAQLFRAKRFNVLAAILFMLTGLGLLLYLIFFLIKKDQTLILEVDAQGKLVVTRHPDQTLTQLLIAAIVVILLVVCLVVVLTTPAAAQPVAGIVSSLAQAKCYHVALMC